MMNNTKEATVETPTPQKGRGYDILNECLIRAHHPNEGTIKEVHKTMMSNLSNDNIKNVITRDIRSGLSKSIIFQSHRDGFLLVDRIIRCPVVLSLREQNHLLFDTFNSGLSIIDTIRSLYPEPFVITSKNVDGQVEILISWPTDLPIPPPPK